MRKKEREVIVSNALYFDFLVKNTWGRLGKARIHVLY